MKMCCCFFHVKYYPKQTLYFSYVMIIATTFTVCLAYRHYRNTRFVQFLVIAYMYVLRFFFFFVFRFVVVFFLLQNAPIAMIFDDAIYLFFFYFLHFISMLLRLSPILKTIQKMGERNEKKNNNFTTANK